MAYSQSIVPSLENLKLRRAISVATPLWVKCEDETHTPKSGNLESSGTPKNLELDCRGHLALGCSLYHRKGLGV
jgi:hypothetical protein